MAYDDKLMGWCKWITAGLGFLFGGFAGLLVGFVLGRILEVMLAYAPLQARSQAGWQQVGQAGDVQQCFFETTFLIMGLLCKADGQVTKDEIKAAITMMDKMRLSPSMRQQAMHLFSRGKQADFNWQQALNIFRQKARGQSQLLSVFLELQLQVALADGVLQSKEEQLLNDIVRHLQIPYQEWLRIRLWTEVKRAAETGRSQSNDYSSSYRQNGFSRTQHLKQLQADYALLGVQESDSDADIKKAYRKMMSQNHPDKMVARGLPEEMIRLATEKTKSIQKAYERIVENRSLA